MKLRQVALVAEHLEPGLGQLRQLFGLPEPYRDPHIIEFGLENAVLPVGDTFLEIVSPVQAGTTAGRYLERRGGDGGYMVILQLDNVDRVRERMSEIGVRIVWQADRERIRGTHLHPRDTGGAILSLDDANPPESWDWAGPSWEGLVNRSVAREITGVEIQTSDPAAMAKRWSEILEAPSSAENDGAQQIELDTGRIRFLPPLDDRGDGVVGIELDAADPDAIRRGAEDLDLSVEDNRIELGGVRFTI